MMAASQARRRVASGVSRAPVSSWPMARSRCRASQVDGDGELGWLAAGGRVAGRCAARVGRRRPARRRGGRPGCAGPGRSRRAWVRVRGAMAASMIAAPSTSKTPDQADAAEPVGGHGEPAALLRRGCCSRSSRSRSRVSARSGLMWARTRSPRRRRMVGSNWAAWPISTVSTLSTSPGSVSGTSARTRPIATAWAGVDGSRR